MFSRTVLIAMAMAITFVAQAVAGAADYAFEAVSPKLKKGDDVTVAVRLLEKSTNKPVTDAVIAKTRIDMGPDGMPTMDSPLTPMPSNEHGVYGFKTSLPMAGHWELSIAAKVQGEAETVRGDVTVKLAK